MIGIFKAKQTNYKPLIKKTLKLPIFSTFICYNEKNLKLHALSLNLPGQRNKIFEN